MGTGAIGPNSHAMKRLAELGKGLSFNARMKANFGGKVPSRVFHMGTDETILHENSHCADQVLQDPATPFSILLNSKKPFCQMAGAVGGIPIAFVFHPQTRYFAFTPYDFGMFHDTLSYSFLVNANPSKHMDFANQQAELIGSPMVKGVVRFGTDGKLNYLSAIYFTIDENEVPSEEPIIDMSLLLFGYALECFGCDKSIGIIDYVPRAGKTSYSGYLRKRGITTLGGLIDRFRT